MAIVLDGTTGINSPSLNAGNIVGQVCFFGMTTAPAGFLKANGAAVSRATYADLFAAIGTTYGTGDGSTTFNLPDLRGEFPRGWDDGRGVDSDRGIGTAQDEQTRLYKATYQGSNAQNSYRGGPFDGEGEGKDVNSSSQTMQRWYRDWQDGQSGRGLLNTRPRNVALLACIKF
jgi:phage-related tail fiber protein